MTIRIVAALFALTAFGAHAQADKKAERLWKAKCSSCHGADGKGDTDQGKKMGLVSYCDPAWQKSKTDAQLKKAIEDGVKREKDGKKQEMDPFKDKLTGEQIDALVAYIRALK